MVGCAGSKLNLLLGVLQILRRRKAEQGLAIGGYESAFLADLVASYLFEKAKAHFYPTIYHGIYRDDVLVVFKGKKGVIEIKDWLDKF